MIDILISKNVLKIFDSFKQLKKNDKEACGILIGKHSCNGQSIRIEIATKPGKKDIRKRMYYEIKSSHHTKVLEKCFKESKFESVYLGTWHTHPESTPSPSKVDIRDWKKQYKKNSHLFDKMVFAIVGTTEVIYWVIEKGTLKKFKKGEENV